MKFGDHPLKRHKKLSFTTRYVLIIGVLLLVANVLLGIVSMKRSTTSIRKLIDKNMLDVANTAADLLDGDALGALTEADVGSDAYNEILDTLSVFQDNADIHFIYAVRQVAEDEFVFTVDADPDDPAAFGEDVVVSSGLIKAGKGVSAVDDAPLQDRWGNYYSSYSPVFDSAGNVAGVVGVDFDAEWYDEQVRANTISITVTSILSVLIGALVVILITYRVRRKLHEIDGGLSALSKNVDRLMEEVVSIYGHEAKPAPEQRVYADELEALGAKIQNMQGDMVLYLDYLQNKAYVDALTKVRSASAYHELVEGIEKKVAAGSARFCVAVFDINSLKEINDTHGHGCGDMIIEGAANAISGAFGVEFTYRIGGDEFAVVLEDVDPAQMARQMDAVDAGVERFNARHRAEGVALAISKGMAEYRPGEDSGYKEVFARADRTMYERKKAYYETVGDRRARDGKPG